MAFFSKSYFIKWTIVGLCIWNVSVALAQTRIQGTITDIATREPLTGVAIAVGTTEGTITDSLGRFDLMLSNGSYTIRYSLVGYRSVERVLSVTGQPFIQMDVALESELQDLNIVVVSASRYEKKLEQEAVSIDVISAKVLQSNNITSLADAVEKVSGVQMMDNQVNIRQGSGYAYGAGSRVMFLVDEQPLLSAELSDIKWSFVPVENSAQIEVIKGSASVLYGSGALNGVINVRTAYPTAKPYTGLTYYTGIASRPLTPNRRWWGDGTHPYTTGIFLAHRQRVGNHLDLVLGGNIHQRDGFIKNDNERRYRFNFNTRYRIPGNNRLTLGVNGNLMYQEVANFFVWQNGAQGAFKHISENFGRDRYGMLTIDPYLTYFDQYNNRHNFRLRYFNISIFRGRGAERSESGLVSGEYQFQHTTSSGWVLTAGATAQHFYANSILFNNNADTSTERALFGGRMGGAYAQAERQWNRLTLTLGSRWEVFSVGEEVATALPVFRSGLNYRVNSRNYLRASFGQGFRFPSLAERYINESVVGDGDLSIRLLPNPGLQPERGWSSELGYKRTFVHNQWRGYADAALYWMEYNNMTEFTFGYFPPDTAPFNPLEYIGFKSINVSRARIAGIELSTFAEGNVSEHTFFRVWGGYNYSFPGNLYTDTTRVSVPNYLRAWGYALANGVDSTVINDVLMFRSLHTARLDLEAEWHGVTLGGAANFNSFVVNVPAIFMAQIPGLLEYRTTNNRGDWVFDLRVGCRVAPRHRVQFIVQNLLNREYTIRPARMQSPRYFNLRYQAEF